MSHNTRNLLPIRLLDSWLPCWLKLEKIELRIPFLQISDLSCIALYTITYSNLITIACTHLKSNMLIFAGKIANTATKIIFNGN
jgi:hypothetical protein